MVLSNFKEIFYLIASITFVMGLKLMSNPGSARRGNLIAAAGMILAITGTIAFHPVSVHPIVYTLIFAAVLIGTIIGWMTAKKVKMTKMPELVSLFNGMGGACAALISMIEFSRFSFFAQIGPARNFNFFVLFDELDNRHVIDRNRESNLREK